MAQVDVAIVGAGAAGIAAARRLVERRRSVLLIEALPRLGGRAHTDQVGGFAQDMGCGWLHSAVRNPLADLAERQGVSIDRSEGAWRNQLDDIDFPARDQEQAWAAYENLKTRLREAPPASDRAGDAIPRDDRWRPYLDALSGYVNGTELDQLSVADFLAYEDAATDDNWRLPGGYGTFIQSLGADLPVLLGASVQAISQGRDVTLETDKGAVHARDAIVTASTAVLAKGAIRFDPALDDHLQAAARLPLGLADKVLLSLADPQAVPAESHLLGAMDRAATGSYYLRPFGRPLVEAFLGGACARALEGAGEDAAAAFAIEELGGLLGADFARGLKPLAVTRWGGEPSIGGSYSHACPGHAAARAVLAAPPSPRLAFAGEACSPHDFSTAHGAWLSGIEAADWVEQSLGPRP